MRIYITVVLIKCSSLNNVVPIRDFFLAYYKDLGYFSNKMLHSFQFVHAISSESRGLMLIQLSLNSSYECSLPIRAQKFIKNNSEFSAWGSENLKFVLFTVDY